MKEFFNIMFGPLKGLTRKEILTIVYATFSFVLLCGEPVGWRCYFAYYVVVLLNFGYACHLVKQIKLNDEEDGNSKD